MRWLRRSVFVMTASVGAGILFESAFGHPIRFGLIFYGFGVFVLGVVTLVIWEKQDV